METNLRTDTVVARNDLVLKSDPRLFLALLDSANDAIQIVDAASLRILDVNATACRVLGYTRAELLEMSIPEIDISTDPLRRTEALQVLRANGTMHWEGLHRRKNGETFPVEVSLSLVVACDREIVVAVVRDVSARKAADARHARLTAALEQAAESVVITDVAGTIEYVNGAFERLSGYRREDVLGKNPRIFQSGEHGRQFYQAMWQALLAGESWMATFTNRRKDGTTFRLHTTISPIVDDRGTVTSYLAVGRDLSRELGLERRLQDSARQLQMLLDASPIGILSYAATGVALSANPAASKLLGGTIDQLCSQNFHEIESWSQAGFLEAATTALETDHEQSREARFVSSFGRAVHVDARFIPYDFDEQRQLLVLLRDITDERRLVEQLAMSQKLEAVGRLAGGVAHDFNNILAVIMSFSQFVRDALPHGDACLDDVLEVLKAVDRAAGLTKQLLIFSKQLPTQKIVIDLNDRTNQLNKFLRRAVGESIELIIDKSREPITVKIDPVQFDQILLNLAINARDAMPEGGKLTIALGTSSSPPGNRARITVTDTGVGMSDEIKSHIFEPFFTTKALGKGTGLGLATCFGIVADAGGSISVSSRVGHGTTFQVDLPMASATPSAEPHVPVALTNAGGKTVLVAEDDEAVRRVTIRALEAAGYRVVPAIDGEDAIRKIDELGSELDLVISDSVMPGCSGESVLRYCERKRPGIATLLTSGYLDGAATTREVLWKPVSPRALVHAAASALERGYRDSPAPSSVPRAVTDSQPERDWSTYILLVEDDNHVAARLRRTLEAGDIGVAVASNLASARTELASRTFDVLVLDVGLPDGSGFDLLRELRDRHDHTPAVMVTGEPSIESAAQAVRHHAHEYLEKPVSPGELRRAIRSAAYDGRAAKMRDQLVTHSGQHEFLRDLPHTEHAFDSALSQIEMVYQPIVRADGSVFAYESLLRSREPTLRTPDRLIAAAEALGRINDLGRGVRASLAADMEAYEGRPELFFVNVHPHELDHDAIGVPPDPLLPLASRVVLEVIERSSLKTSPDLLRTLAAIRDRGYRLAIDDLGEGYAALSSLVRLRPEFAKIDMSLVRSIHQAPTNEPVVRAIVSLAHGSGIRVIAEGIEQPEEHNVLLKLGCDLFQGYLFGRPAPLPSVAGR